MQSLTTTTPNPSSAQLTTRHRTPTGTLLPGQDVVDQRLVDETVLHLNESVERGGLATMRTIAAVLLSTMFEDESARFLRDAQTHATYQALTAHPELKVSKSALWYAVAIEENFRVLGETAEPLTLSHHKRLVHVKSRDDRLALAKLAIQEGMSVRQLEQRIGNTQPERSIDSPRLGRPPQPLPVKLLRQVDVAIAALEPAQLPDLPQSTAASLLLQAETARRTLTQWIEALRTRVGTESNP